MGTPKPKPCPGSKIRSKGKGKGLGRGQGKGPVGRPVGKLHSDGRVKKSQTLPFLEKR